MPPHLEGGQMWGSMFNCPMWSLLIIMRGWSASYWPVGIKLLAPYLACLTPVPLGVGAPHQSLVRVGAQASYLDFADVHASVATDFSVMFVWSRKAIIQKFLSCSFPGPLSSESRGLFLVCAHQCFQVAGPFSNTFGIYEAERQPTVFSTVFFGSQSPQSICLLLSTLQSSYIGCINNVQGF